MAKRILSLEQRLGGLLIGCKNISPGFRKDSAKSFYFSMAGFILKSENFFH